MPAVKVKMTPEVAWPIVTSAEKLKRVTGREAKAILLMYFRLRNYPSDRYGNYFPVSGSRDERFHFKKRNIQRQTKHGGRWSNRWSVSIIEFAEDLIITAGDVADAPERVAHIKKKSEQRQEAAETQAVRRRSKKELAEAGAITREYIIQRHWDLAYPIMIRDENSGATKRFFSTTIGKGRGKYTIEEEATVKRDEVLEELLRGKTPAPPAYSTDKPPLLIFEPDRVFKWDEELDGKTYTVALVSPQGRARRRDNMASVHIGKLGRMEILRPGYVNLKGKGDGSLRGVIKKFKGKPPRGGLSAINAPNKEAALRLLYLWCDLLCGYKVDDWVVPDKDPETKWIHALVRTNKANFIVKQGDHLVIECIDLRPNRSSSTFIPPADVARAAARGLELRRSLPPSRRCCTTVGIRRAAQLKNRQPVSVATLKRMKAYFDRHRVDAKGRGWGVDSKGYQAWLLWGGDPGYAWAKKMVKAHG